MNTSIFTCIVAVGVAGLSGCPRTRIIWDYEASPKAVQTSGQSCGASCAECGATRDKSRAGGCASSSAAGCTSAGTVEPWADGPSAVQATIPSPSVDSNPVVTANPAPRVSQLPVQEPVESRPPAAVVPVVQNPFAVVDQTDPQDNQSPLDIIREGGGRVSADAETGSIMVNLSQTQLTPQLVIALAGVEELQQLDLAGTNIRNADLATIAQIESLRLLILADTNVSDEGISKLVALPHLEYLVLNGSQVSDAVLDSVRKIRTLRGLSLLDTAITTAAVDRLKQSHPDCRVIHRPSRGEPEATSAPNVNSPASVPAETPEVPVHNVWRQANEQPAKITPTSSWSPADSLPVTGEFSETATVEFYEALAAVHRKRGNWEQVAEVLGSGIARFPGRKSLHEQMGDALSHLGREQEALEHFTKSVGSAEAHYRLGIVIYNRGVAASRAHFEQAIDVNPRLQNAHQWLEKLNESPSRNGVEIVPVTKLAPATNP